MIASVVWKVSLSLLYQTYFVFFICNWSLIVYASIFSYHVSIMDGFGGQPLSDFMFIYTSCFATLSGKS